MIRRQSPLQPGLTGSATRCRGRRRARKDPRQKGIALVMAVTAIAILTVVLADMHESTSTAYAISVANRDRLKAEYMAKSGLNLTRLLVAKEPAIRQVVTPFYQALVGRPPPQLPIWTMANDLLKPFCDYEATQRMNTGIDFRAADGLGDTDATCTIVSFAENSKINVNAPLNFTGDRARRSISMQLFAMMGGYQSPSPYDPLFQNLDRDGQLTRRLDVVSSLIDWWDEDTDRTVFDPSKRDHAWRRAHGLADDDVAIVFLGRLVMEKGLDVFAETIVQLRKRQVPHKVLVIGDGPAREWFEKALPGGIFAGFQTGRDLGKALASGDIFFNLRHTRITFHTNR